MSMIPPSASTLRGAVDLSGLVQRAAQPAASAAPATGAANGAQQASGPIPVPSLVVDSDDAAFTGLLELSNTVPIIVEFHAGQAWAGIAAAVRSYGGRLLLASVDATRSPQLQQAFSVAAVPTVAAVIGGRPLALFEGEIADDQLRQMLDQVLTLAAQNGVTGTVTVDGEEGEPAEPSRSHSRRTTRRRTTRSIAATTRPPSPPTRRRSRRIPETSWPWRASPRSRC